MVAIAVLAAGAPVARAQSEDYYREITVEDRIYVFSTEAKFTAYEQSKDMGVSITRLGYGPNGETVIFEDAKAVELFNRKHGKSEAPPEEVKTPEIKLPFNVQYRMPGLRFSFAKAEINLSNRVQFRYTQEDLDTATEQADRGSFRIRRARTKLDGWIYTRDLNFEVQADWVGLGSVVQDQSGPILVDANIDYDFTKGKRAFRLKVGQFKAPFGRQELTSSGNQQFVDRSIASVLFAPSRQLGAQVHGQFGSAEVPDFFTYAAGVFNGNGIVRPRNDNDEFQYVARVMFSPWGNVGYSESNLESYPFRMSFGGGYNQNKGIVIPGTGVPTGTDVKEEFGADVAAKLLGSLSAYFEYYWRTVQVPGAAETPQTGFAGQVGWLFLPKWEIAGRWSETDLNTDRSDRNITEKLVGLSWFFNKHNWKIQADYGEARAENLNGANGRPPASDNFLRIQAQLIF